jgi:hypothetical protein
MSADDSRINQQMFEVTVLGEVLEQLFKDLEFAPPGEAFIDGVPAAVLARQESPLRAAPRNPQDGFKEAAHVAPGSESDLGKVFKTGRIFCHWSSVSLTVIT